MTEEPEMINLLLKRIVMTKRHRKENGLLKEATRYGNL